MPDWVVAFMFGAGVGGWAFTQLAKRTGSGSSRETVIGSLVVFILAYLFLFSLFRYVLHIS
jgi:hypothetical protein